MRDPLIAGALEPGIDVSTAIGVEPGWVEHAILSVGNYGDMFERVRSSLH